MRWVVTVSYRNPDGKVYTKVRIYPLSYQSNGKAQKLDQTRVIRDIVPQDCTTTKISIRKSAT